MFVHLPRELDLHQFEFSLRRLFAAAHNVLCGVCLGLEMGGRACVQKWLSYLKLEKLEVGFQLPCSLSHLPAAVIYTPVRFTWRTRWSGDPRGANHLLP